MSPNECDTCPVKARVIALEARVSEEEARNRQREVNDLEHRAMVTSELNRIYMIAIDTRRDIAKLVDALLP